MKIYNYDKTTHEFIGESQADLNPAATQAEGKNIYMLPANATETKPPKLKKHQAAVYNNGWDVVDDFRGMFKVNEKMRPEPINKLGALEEGYIAITETEAKKIIEDPLYYIIDNDKLIVNPNYANEKLEKAKEEKLNEALIGAKSFIENEACYQYDENNSIEATDGNIGKLTAYALGFQAGLYEQVEWTSKEDNVITLNQEDLLRALAGLGQIQSSVWNTQYVNFKTQIEEAQTAADVYSIEIIYEV